MLFNSLEFAVFFPLVFGMYWFVVNRNLRLQNAFLVLASYVFYGWWDWRFLFLIAFSSAVDYGMGLMLDRDRQTPKARIWLIASLVVNLGLLGVFKYYNFFAESFVDAFSLLGQPLEVRFLNIILPVGISFYTFQTLSYSIDIYRGKLEPTRDPVAFFAFVSFFPQLVAGPIERASNLLPQFFKKRKFNYAQAVDGSRQILWGLFKKVALADTCAPLVNTIFEQHESLSGLALFGGSVLFAFQIYGDFSGYSDIAIGTSRLFGFNLMQNFAFPYFSRDIAEFWRRWHISLSTWFRDYLYIPLGGSRGGTWMKVRNTFAIFLVSGFWHGANWTFVVWGGLNALYFLPLLLAKKNRNNLNEAGGDGLFPGFREVLGMTYTFVITCFAWIFFRADNVGEATTYIGRIFTGITDSPIAQLTTAGIGFGEMGAALFFIAMVSVIEWLNRREKHGLTMRNITGIRAWAVYYVLLFLIVASYRSETPFIYFQF